MFKRLFVFLLLASYGTVESHASCVLSAKEENAGHKRKRVDDDSVSSKRSRPQALPIPQLDGGSAIGAIETDPKENLPVKAVSHEREGIRPSVEVTTSTSSISSTGSASSGQHDHFNARFDAIRGKKLIAPFLHPITAEKEDKEGGRKWVKYFVPPEQVDREGIHAWHREKNKRIKAIQQRLSTPAENGTQVLPKHTNYAFMRLTFVVNGQETTDETYEYPYVFASGLPSTPNGEAVGEFFQSTASGEIRGVQFLKERFSSKQPQGVPTGRDAEQLKQEVEQIMESVQNQDLPIIHLTRAKIHQKTIKTDQFAYFYFHSEQALRGTIKEEILKRNEKLRRSAVIPRTIKKVYVDICSYYDMCWCCGDTLASACQIKAFGEVEVFIRCTGVFPRRDQVPPGQRWPDYQLRDHCEEFPGYETGQGYQMVPYTPHVSHATVEDFPA